MFVPIFLKLKEIYGYEFHILQFTSADSSKIEKRKIDFEDKGLAYQGIPVNAKSSILSIFKAKYWDIRSILQYIKKHQIEVLMPRAVTSLFIFSQLIKKSSLKLVFDADGFPLDERVDFSGLSPLSLRYRFFRDVEFMGYQSAGSILCRSQKAKGTIIARAGAGLDVKKIFVINNGTFASSLLSEIQKTRKPSIILIYAGSLGPQYMLDDMLNIFEMILYRFPEALFKILTFKVEETNAFIRHHFPKLLRAIEVKSVPAGNVLEELEKADIAFSFRKPSFSMQGVAPIKVAEYLRAGLSIVYTPSTGDVEELLGGKSFAFRMDIKEGIKPDHFLDWVKEQVDKDYSQEVRNFASERFSIERTADLYHQAIQYGDK